MYNGGHRNLGCVAYAREPVLDQILWGACTFWRLFGSAFRTRLARLHNTDFEILASALRSLNVALRPSARCMPVSNTIELGTFGWDGHVRFPDQSVMMNCQSARHFLEAAASYY